MPDTVRDATANYFEDEDVVSQWIEDRCETKESHSTPFTELYKNWEAWCRDNGEDWGTWKRFSVQLQSHGFQRDRKRVEKKLRRRFKGIGLKGQV
jgi:putative DNA primase/helicase